MAPSGQPAQVFLGKHRPGRIGGAAEEDGPGTGSDGRPDGIEVKLPHSVQSVSLGLRYSM